MRDWFIFSLVYIQLNLTVFKNLHPVNIAYSTFVRPASVLLKVRLVLNLDSDKRKYSRMQEGKESGKCTYSRSTRQLSSNIQCLDVCR